MAKYLNSITIQSNRKAMAQLRLSSHKLMVEPERTLVRMFIYFVYVMIDGSNVGLVWFKREKRGKLCLSQSVLSRQQMDFIKM